MPRERFVHRHAAAPTVVHDQGIARIRYRRAQMGRDKTMQSVGAIIHVAAIATDKHSGCHEALAVRQAMAKFALRRIQPGRDGHLQGLSCGAHVDAYAPAEFDAKINARTSGRILDRHPGNHLGGLRIGSRPSFEPVAVTDWFAMRAGIRGPAAAFFHPPILQRLIGRRVQPQREAGLERNVNRFTVPVHDFEMMLDRPRAGLCLPD